MVLCTLAQEHGINEYWWLKESLPQPRKKDDLMHKQWKTIRVQQNGETIELLKGSQGKAIRIGQQTAANAWQTIRKVTHSAEQKIEA
ncbi:hypothetical protein KBY58_04885 [Cyanobium sp. HWJ4-Hawea]|uniref:hypothetical protein n=1 Tax=unclassified Cyanobium TaxID=2627006 RepID=UPI0020CFBDBC|nr:MULTISPECIES: hypothetical protein [unclassified Cyanobium]MCP9775896.1 hypothetical protein [Cyanobium sp. WAJ14-Wanaka]MCP9808764.1 hypothetical protein [Cyanobium sp. HWJ4-Hawea]